MNTNEIVEALGNLTMLEVIALTKELREKWGISEKVHPIMEPADKFVKAVEETLTVVDIILVPPKADGGKIPAIKLIRELTNCGLSDGKKLSETPNSVIMTGVEYAVAQTIVERFKEIGAEIKLVPASE